MNNVIKKLGEIGIVPVVSITDAGKAVRLAEALVEGGIPCMEITFRTEAGAEAIRLISKAMPEILVGAGTVLTTAQADAAIDAGAKFLVAPGFNPKTVDYAIEKGIPMLPGCATPSDMEQAIARNLEVVKFFPAQQAGGLAYIKAVSAPYTSLSFMPTGGINIGNLKEYISFKRILACGGSWMVSPELIDAGRFGEITKYSAEAVEAVKQARGS